MKRLAVLFGELFRISLFVIGGGYAIIAVADQVFARRRWTKEGELLDHLPIFQMIPGLIATHVAVYVGRKMAGWLGAAVGVLAVALPSVVIFTFVAMGYQQLPLENPFVQSAFVGLRSALTGIIGATLVRSWLRNLTDAFAYSVLLVALGALLLGVPVWLVLVVAMVAGLLQLNVKAYRSSALSLLLFLKYGALCFGGGFVLVPMYLEDFVGPEAAFLQVPPEEFASLMALTQLTPGPIGVNGATYFGFRLAGIAGAVLASAALLLPGSLLAYGAFASLDRFKTHPLVRGILTGVRPASVALMLVALGAFAAMAVFPSHTFHPLAIPLTLLALYLTMKKKLNPILLILSTAFVALTLRADDTVTSERYPDADTVVLDDRERVTYQPNGAYESVNESWTKILTEKGRREESVQTLNYSKRYGEAAFLAVDIQGTNGVVRSIDLAHATKESTDNSSMSVNIYDPLDRRILCRIPDLKVGETLHVKTRRAETKPRCQNQWADISVLEWSSPICRASYEVVSPPARPLRALAVRHPLGNLVTNCVRQADGSWLYSFVATNSPQVFPEPDMPPLYTQVQHVLVSTAKSWREISRWYWDLCAPHLAKTNAALVAKARTLKSVEAIFKFVSQEIRYMGLTLEDTSPGYAPHDVDLTFDNRYGVCRDKAGLLVAMLRAAGHEAYPTLINVGAKKDHEVPMPFFNHAVVALAEGKGYRLMDPTNENTKDLFPSYESDKSYLVCRPEGEDLRTSPVPEPSHNRLTARTTGHLAKDGSLFLESALAFSGINDTLYRGALVRKTPEERTKFFERVLKSLCPGAELVSCTVEPSDLRATDTPLAVRLMATCPEAVLFGETVCELNVPCLTRALGLANFLLSGNTSLEQRVYPLVLDSTAETLEEVSIDLKDVVGAAQVLPAEKIGAPDEEPAGFSFARHFAVTNDELTLSRRLTIGAVEFSATAYRELREVLKRCEAAERRKPVFAVDALAEADVNILLDSSETTIFSDRAWVTTNTVEKEVLTYAGKKGSAELKFSYNPTVETIELLGASVSNRDGCVYRVTPREMNTLDCSWAAAAPRYPAGKLLVVNLPSVEIGSVISYSTVRQVTNAPASFYAAYCFDSTLPLARRVVRVNDWRREVVSPKRLPTEPNQPPAAVWRDRVVVSSNRFECLDLQIDAYAGSPEHPLPMTDLTPLGIRDWMARFVKIAGPSLYDLPLAAQLTPPETVLTERYATRLDYIRTLCSVLRGAGYEADVVFSACNADDPPARRTELLTGAPNVRAFALPLCRLREREGGFLGWGGELRETFIGTENEYTPLGASAWAGSDYFDLATATFGRVTEPRTNLAEMTERTTLIDVREDGAVDLTQETLLFGSGVGAFRRRYAEILPEERSRRYQAILGDLSQAASATSELETDVTSYPARRKFACYIPDFARVEGDRLTIQLPALISSIPTVPGKSRQTPYELPSADASCETVRVRFPEGYTQLEHLPESFVFADPSDPACRWLSCEVSSAVRSDVLEVTLRRRVFPHPASDYAPDVCDLIRARNRTANSRANRTIIVRRMPQP